jgi:uncharacterized integral membrane protein (TIGR00697 family)
VQRKSYKYYEFVMAAFVCVLLCSNLIGAPKVARVGSFTFGAGVFFFPISYIFGDILTEVYGYARSRRVVWAGFAAMLFASFMCWFVLWLPPAPGWADQAAFEKAFGSTWRIVAGSLMAFCVGEFCNSYVLAKMKIWTEGRWLWTRTIGSTIVGEAVDTLIFYPIAFYANWPNDLLITVMINNYLLKTGWEIVVTPVTYVVVGWLKRAENEDYYDRDTDFNPFTVRL